METLTPIFGDKVIRFSAIEETPGYVGCTKSHIAILKMALENKWKNVLVLEDDIAWNNFEEGYARLETLASSNYDCILLGATGVVYYPDTLRLVKAQTTTAYLINAHYIPTLLDNFEEGLVELLKTNDRDSYALDMYWKSIQSRDIWFVIVPSLLYQTPGYSDIENAEVSYLHYFGVKRKPKATLPYQKLFKK